MKDYADVWEAEREISRYFRWYNDVSYYPTSLCA